MKEALKVGVSGVRGIVGDSLTPQVAVSFAQAFGTFVGGGAVLVGRDTRPSGIMIEYAVVAGLLSVGCKPILAGIVPTPTLLMMTKSLGVRGGIAITASHNSEAWNALKFIGRSGLFLSESRSDELFDIYHQQDFPLIPESKIAVTDYLPGLVNEHFRRVWKYVNAGLIRQKRFKVAVDCCNGVGAVHSVHFLEELGCEVVALGDKPSGFFERDPEPRPENIRALSEAVVREHCDVGFAQDPDGDRLALVSEQGKPLGEDMTLAFAVQQVLSSHARGPVVVNVPTSKCVEHIARQWNCEVIRTKTGEVNVSEVILKIGAVVGGENIGGVIIPAIHPCRDSYAGMAIVLELMASSGQSVSELRAAIPEYHIIREKIAIRGDQAPTLLRVIRREYSNCKMDLLDGVYVDFDNRWFLARRSNTEPVLRITAEGPTLQAARELVDEVRAKITPLI